MANIDNLPLATVPATENTASTPTPSRAASRARRRAASTVTETPTEGTNLPETGSTDLGLPARDDAVVIQDGQSAEGANQPETGSTDLGLPDRGESNNTTETQAAPEVQKEPTKLYVLAAKNPKRDPSIAHKFFQMYYGTGENNRLTTVEEAYARGVRGKDRSWDADRGHILIGDDVDAYLALEDGKARAEWLVAKFNNMPKDRLLKMVGIAIEEPKVAEQVVESADAKGEVKPETEAGATEEVKAELEGQQPVASEEKKEEVTA